MFRPTCCGLEIYPRYSTTLFLSLTATDEPGFARHNAALEPTSNSILNSERGPQTKRKFKYGRSENITRFGK